MQSIRMSDAGAGIPLQTSRFARSRWRDSSVRRNGPALLMAAYVIPALFAGCTTPLPSRIEDSQSVPPLVMYLQPGDELEVNFFGAPELNAVQFIRRDGQISLRLVGEVKAAGKTPQQLQDLLRDLYAKQLQIKDVTVVLRTPPPVLVTGAVLKPGRVPLSRPLTVLDAVMESGGFNAREAEVRSVVLIRQADGKRTSFIFDFEKALRGEGQDRTFYVQPFDIIYVPQTLVVRANQWVDQHINKMLPDLGVGYSSEGETTVFR